MLYIEYEAGVHPIKVLYLLDERFNGFGTITLQYPSKWGAPWRFVGRVYPYSMPLSFDKPHTRGPLPRAVEAMLKLLGLYEDALRFDLK